ncbi:hybrid sensor histidine kinase/response regulator [Leptospira perolatii]|uniref:hybrid sensor histidine kinase/response regulator n=1 Tax=Leptospira perolatii TaxID=2023191 RepID=UPI000F642116|nr:PAS domain-containing sensor histidine kinase [Leptospira perolatii]
MHSQRLSFREWSSMMDEGYISEGLQSGIELIQGEFLYQAIAKNFPNGAIAIFDRDLRYVLIEGEILPDLGLSPKLIVGKLAREVLPPDIYATMEPHYRATLLGQKTVCEISLRERIFNVHHVPIKQGAGEIAYGMAMIQDITENKKVENELRESRHIYQELVENISDVIFSLDIEGRVTFVSSVVEPKSGYKIQEILNKHFLDFVVEEDKGPVQKIINSTIKGNREVFEHRALVKSGQYLWVQISTHPIVRDGKIVGVGGIMKDVTKRRQLEHQLIQAQKLDSLGNLAGGIAHDFNNILSIMLGHLSLLEKYSDDVERRTKNISSIGNAINRGTSLVRQLLTFARRADTTMELLNINNVVSEVVSLLKQTFPKLIQIESSLEEKMPLILADHTQIHQVIINLCINARDAMLPSGGKLLLRVCAVSCEQVRAFYPDATPSHYIELSVSDTGEGMDEFTRERIFEPFFTTKEPGKGTGLGLATVFGIVERHRGYITVESTLGVGTKFHLYFPAQTESSSFKLDSGTHLTEPPGGRETILVVEDEEMLREMVRVLLEGKGYTVLMVPNGREAINKYGDHLSEIDLVLSDIGLPEISGDQLFYQMKKLQPKLKVILASGFIDPEKKIEMIRAGVKDVLQKPYIPNEILKKIRSAIDDQLIE